MAHYQKKLLRLGWAVPKRHMVLERKISSCMDHLSNTLYYFYSVLKLSDTKGITVLKAFASMLLFSVFQMPWAWKHEIKKNNTSGYDCSLPEIASTGLLQLFFTCPLLYSIIFLQSILFIGGPNDKLTCFYNPGLVSGVSTKASTPEDSRLCQELQLPRSIQIPVSTVILMLF